MPIFRFRDKILLFIHIPKTGGTSVEKVLSDAGGVEALRDSVLIPGMPCTPQHFHAAILESLLPRGLCDFAFTIVRNPFDRLASEYKMRVLGPDRAIGFDDWFEVVLRRHARNPFVNDNHIRPQHEFLIDGADILRFEQSPMTALRYRLAQMGIDCPAEFPWERRSAHAEVLIRGDTAERIRTFYAEDFVRLGYRVDDLGGSLKLID